MRRTFSTVVVLAAMMWLPGCGSESQSDEPAKPPLYITHSTVPLPSSTRPAGPPVTAACPLLSPAVVASAIGVSDPQPHEEPVNKGTDHTSYKCRYGSAAGWFELTISIEPVTKTAEQAILHSVAYYSGSLERVADLGDAALYIGSDIYSSVYVAQVEGAEMRTVSLSAFVKGNPKDRMLALARDVLGRV